MSVGTGAYRKGRARLDRGRSGFSRVIAIGLVLMAGPARQCDAEASPATAGADCEPALPVESLVRELEPLDRQIVGFQPAAVVERLASLRKSMGCTDRVVPAWVLSSLLFLEGLARLYLADETGAVDDVVQMEVMGLWRQARTLQPDRTWDARRLGQFGQELWAATQDLAVSTQTVNSSRALWLDGQFLAAGEARTVMAGARHLQWQTVGGTWLGQWWQAGVEPFPEIGSPAAPKPSARSRIRLGAALEVSRAPLVYSGPIVWLEGAGRLAWRVGGGALLGPLGDERRVLGRVTAGAAWRLDRPGGVADTLIGLSWQGWLGGRFGLIDVNTEWSWEEGEGWVPSHSARFAQTMLADVAVERRVGPTSIRGWMGAGAVLAPSSLRGPAVQGGVGVVW